MKTNHIIHIFFAFLAMAFIACEDEVNQWAVEKEYDQLFASLIFEEVGLEATSVTIKYSMSPEATEYIFEFSEDSLLFESIVRREILLFDTLTQINNTTSPMKIEYRASFDNLKGVTPYSVRMTARDNRTGRTSRPLSLYFKTPAEQIINDAVVELESIALNWMAGRPVTHINLFVNVEGDRFQLDRKIDLSDEEKAAGATSITGLASGTKYLVVIYDGEIQRGSIAIRTLGIPNSELIYVNPEDTLSHILDDCAERKITDLSLVFKGGLTYDSGDVSIPGGIQNLMFVGEKTEELGLPQLLIPSISLAEGMESILFEKVALDGLNASKNYLFSLGSGYCFRSVEFNNCEVSHFNRSVVRINSKDLAIDNIKFSNCLLHDIGKSGYGLINLSAQKEVKQISITECTMTELGDQIMQTDAGVLSVVVDKSTFYNKALGIGKIFRFNIKPAEVSVTNTIFSGPNGGTKVNSGNGDYSSYLSFESCYITTDFEVNTRPFTGIKEYAGTSDDLFADPSNGDFHIKEGARFEGKGVAGDPRWW